MRNLFLILVLLVFVFSFSCKKKNAEELKCEPKGLYSSEVSVIFSNSCMPCHSDSRREAGVALDSYDEVIKVSSTTLLGVVRHESGFLPMPQGGGKLSDCDIKKIEAWINTGSPNN